MRKERQLFLGTGGLNADGKAKVDKFNDLMNSNGVNESDQAFAMLIAKFRDTGLANEYLELRIKSRSEESRLNGLVFGCVLGLMVISGASLIYHGKKDRYDNNETIFEEINGAQDALRAADDFCKINNGRTEKIIYNSTDKTLRVRCSITKDEK